MRPEHLRLPRNKETSKFMSNFPQGTLDSSWPFTYDGTLAAA